MSQWLGCTCGFKTKPYPKEIRLSQIEKQSGKYCKKCGQEMIYHSDGSMTKLEALKAMLEGHKITHKYFDPHEYIHMVNDQIMTEDGCYFDDAWDERKERVWKDGWFIYENIEEKGESE